MVKQPKQKEENPLHSLNIPKAPPVSADQPVQKEEQHTMQSSTLQQNSNAVTDGTMQQSDNTAMPQDTVKQQSNKTAQREKITFYLEPEQANKLYDFMEAWRHRTGVKINQQDMLRRIIDVMTLDAVLP